MRTFLIQKPTFKIRLPKFAYICIKYFKLGDCFLITTVLGIASDLIMYIFRTHTVSSEWGGELVSSLGVYTFKQLFCRDVFKHDLRQIYVTFSYFI